MFDWTLNVPMWAILLISAVLPTVWLLRATGKAERVRNLACPVCGYNLRATPRYCPECGASPLPEPTSAVGLSS
jgi:hypothetical protein